MFVQYSYIMFIYYRSRRCTRLYTNYKKYASMEARYDRKEKPGKNTRIYCKTFLSLLKLLIFIQNICIVIFENDK